MSKVNGNNFFGLEWMKNIKPNFRKNNETEKTIDVKSTNTPETKELGDDLLTTQTFYPDVNFSKSSTTESPTNLTSLTELQNITVTGNVDNNDRKLAFNLAPDRLTSAYMYGNMSEKTHESLKEFSDNFFELQDPNYTFHVPADVA